MVVMVMLTKMEKVIMKMIMIIINEWKHSILIHVCFALICQQNCVKTAIRSCARNTKRKKHVVSIVICAAKLAKTWSVKTKKVEDRA